MVYLGTNVRKTWFIWVQTFGCPYYLGNFKTALGLTLSTKTAAHFLQT